MKKVFASSNLLEINTVRHLIEAAGIPTAIRNEHTGTMLPLGDLTQIELWVTDAARADEGRGIANDYLESQRSNAEDGPPWNCTACGEPNPANFALCWQCGAERG